MTLINQSEYVSGVEITYAQFEGTGIYKEMYILESIYFLNCRYCQFFIWVCSLILQFIHLLCLPSPILTDDYWFLGLQSRCHLPQPSTAQSGVSPGSCRIYMLLSCVVFFLSTEVRDFALLTITVAVLSKVRSLQMPSIIHLFNEKK